MLGPDPDMPTGAGLRLRVPDGRYVVVHPRAGEHELFGVCDVIELDGQALALSQAVDWDAPSHIPPLDRPAVLPRGVGSAILNHLATAAARRGIPSLRYRGPYPTAALFGALLDCFRVDEPRSAFERFTHAQEQIALSGEMHEPPVDFYPDPFERVWHDPHNVCVQLRRGVEKIFVDGKAYSREEATARRVRRDRERPDEWLAVLEMGGVIWAEIARVDARGQLLDGPRPVPHVDNVLIGESLPESVRQALLQALPRRAPRLLRPTMERVIQESPLVWEDTGDALARVHDGRIEVHAALPEQFSERSPLELLETIAHAVEPALQRLSQQILAASFKR